VSTADYDSGDALSHIKLETAVMAEIEASLRIVSLDLEFLGHLDLLNFIAAPLLVVVELRLHLFIFPAAAHCV
jgi:hypothetical protein